MWKGGKAPILRLHGRCFFVTIFRLCSRCFLSFSRRRDRTSEQESERRNAPGEGNSPPHWSYFNFPNRLLCVPSRALVETPAYHAFFDDVKPFRLHGDDGKFNKHIFLIRCRRWSVFNWMIRFHVLRKREFVFWQGLIENTFGDVSSLGK